MLNLLSYMYNIIKYTILGDENMSQFPQRLKKLRIENGIQQKDLAQILNYGATAISNYERGTHEPSYDVLIKIANFFNVTVDYLIGNNYASKELSDFDYELISQCGKLNNYNKNILLAIAKSLEAEQKNAKK